ncbi:hypothetical protein [Tepidibacter formicigenes]|jgi:competence protein ComGC|uniref:Uncharacterized protein n=1 Tax=Tepidibacter formicigenes DSM 15518 TaxID=1123349 RepID=A0A1M6U9D6_9FIRM|nr:hypothetical protein [Tepidibacter formicigenes]SHK65885.1 hypothetical protein SAMN02744037_02761 [Tepidibacter formicigenes DSM 15518]
MGKVIDFKVAKKKIESKKKKCKFKTFKNNKIHNYKALIILFIVILSITSLFFLFVPMNTPKKNHYIESKYSMDIFKIRAFNLFFS